MRRRTLLRRGGATLIVVALLCWALAPKPSLYGDTGFSAAVYASDGTLLRLTLAPDQRYRLFTPLAQLPAQAIDATLLYEDRWFFEHPGINPAAVLRAAWTTFVTSERTLGASTLTMQLARLRFAIDSSSVAGKLEQMLRALQLERHYSKQEILEAYLNLAPYGGNIEGLGTASLVYFGKPAIHLTLNEVLSLVVVPQNPVQRAPDRGDGDALREARLRAFALWQAAHPDDAAQQASMAAPLRIQSRGQLPFLAPHFVDALLARYGAGSWHSTLDLSLQHTVEQQMTAHLAERRLDGLDNAAVLVVDTRDQAIAAWVGSADFFDDALHGQVDGVTARRSPGSTLKPFVYARALEQGLLHPRTLLKDLPTRFGAYTPENFDRGFLGPVTAQDALVYSRNVPAVDIAEQLQPDFHDFLRRAGIANLRERDFYGLAIALGGVEVSMLELAGLYTTLVNAGVRTPLAWRKEERGARPGERLLSAEAAFITLQMLKQNPRPDGRVQAPATAWKTGTSWAFRDAWSIGLAGHYLIAVWVGHFDGHSNPALVGQRAAAPLLFRLVDHLGLEGNPAQLVGDTSTGLNVKQVEVCASSGDLPGKYCPRTVASWYIPGVSPIRVDTLHRLVAIDPVTGLRACDANAPGNRHDVMEFWPSDLLALFRLAGLPRKQPPPYSPDCNLASVDRSGAAPGITSPSDKLEYGLQPDHPEHNRIPLKAVADASASRLYWFEDDRFIVAATPGETPLWSPAPGEYVLRAVDDLGRSDAVRVRVRLLPAH